MERCDKSPDNELEGLHLSIKILLKMAASLTAPLAVGLTAFGLTEKAHASAALLSVLFFGVSVAAGLRLIKELKRLVAVRTEEARLRYQHQDFRALKTLFLARPYEAAQFIEIKKRQGSRPRIPQQLRHAEG